jgi:hypothetical protein
MPILQVKSTRLCPLFLEKYETNENEALKNKNKKKKKKKKKKKPH